MENLETHQQVYDQIEESATAGVARAADLEQIAGRLSLAQTNVITEQSNLHDVIARYLRIVGSMPPEQMEQLQLELRSLADKHIKDVKFKDLQLVRERKKWIATEQALKTELEDIKMSPAYQRLQLEKSPELATASVDELKVLVEKLRAEKASLVLQMSALKERTARDMKNLEKKLKEPEHRDPAPAPAPALGVAEKKEIASLYSSTRSVSSSLIASPSSSSSSSSSISKMTPTNKSTSMSLLQKLPNISSSSVASEPSLAEVSVEGSIATRKSLSSTAYRRQLRSRKFSSTKVAE
jgi:hypothetical protein